jgi:2-polyprenyl-3-methyl-5-hydroxy-6-metoxy-1,4-benzoquinol methylase
MSYTQTQEFFQSYATNFNSIYSSRNSLLNAFTNRVFRKSMRLRYLKTIEGCEPVQGKTVLDIGCGPGHYGVELARRGAAQVVGIDFAERMIDLARYQAETAGVSARCEFMVGDFNLFRPGQKFDHVIVMGFMDYIADPRPLIDGVLSLTSGQAFFSFPAAGGILGWQRRLRYRNRCPLFLYTREEVEHLFLAAGVEPRIEPIARDFFVTINVVQQ